MRAAQKKGSSLPVSPRPGAAGAGVLAAQAQRPRARPGGSGEASACSEHRWQAAAKAASVARAPTRGEVPASRGSGCHHPQDAAGATQTARAHPTRDLRLGIRCASQAPRTDRSHQLPRRKFGMSDETKASDHWQRSKPVGLSTPSAHASDSDFTCNAGGCVARARIRRV